MTSNSAKSYKVEYLCTIDSDGDFCKSISSFKSLLKSYDKLKIEDKKIVWDSKEFAFEISDGKVLNSNHKFFHLKFVNANANNKQEFLSLLKIIRTILSKVNNNQPPEILWDDISSEYAIQSYPVIHELENLMRKLITKFMITKVGLSWTKENIPKEVAESIKGTGTSKKQNYIYDTDFIQLSRFLFNEYTTTKVEDLVSKIKKANKIDELDFNDLKKVVPVSNWTRYFNPIVECTSEELSTKWDKLYKLRCKVAHNNFMDEDDFTNLISLSNDVKSIIEDAINNLDKVSVTEEDKEELVESAAINLNKFYGEFVLRWKKLESLLMLFSKNSYRIKNKKYPLKAMFQELVQKQYLTIKDYDEFDKLNNIRNMIVHEANFELDEFQLNLALKDLEILINKISNISSSFDSLKGWYEIIKYGDSYSFYLKNHEGFTLIFSELYMDKEAALQGLEKFKIRSLNINNYIKFKVDGLGFSFNLLSENGSILAKSSFYTDSELRDLKIDETIKISETDIIIDPPNNDETYALSS
ncbi:hypothetical protein J809_0801 [Acinetobacter sp. 25977_6]|uniref:Apea-like HEPN domain-containing protein n=3 Tax=Acinetobacter TaxID=469 RepID=A0AB36M157_ACINO|nr:MULTISPECIES: HEPN domain-containing protein [Acinetobacter calcoaceticus/baumannii complex]KCZ35284.1 hypothetical protein J812_0128 [Acinetobacter baumannii 25977_9]EXB66918.1 hypothetical protein J525_3122 [Acinetobacter sp. 21871]EXR60128.1 hypothetical protein J678_3388 [Acinetobacter sp. 1424608]EXT38757.1 hypothetical protein J811_1745 [Acinetobacter sp. 25977_8]EXT46224.1 hypothetical protein J810_0863 [Acinetobacter sp. 25977_7]